MIFILQKHLLLQRSDGILHFIDYKERKLDATLSDFSSKDILSIDYNEQNNLYVIKTDKGLDFYHSVSFECIRKFAQNIRDYSLRADGLGIIVTTDNKAFKFKLTDPQFNNPIEIQNGKIDSVKFSSNGLFFGVKLSNPYCLAVWDVESPISIFSFNENNMFGDFVFEGKLDVLETVAICYYEDYAKVYDCSTGCFLQSHDFSRKQLKQIFCLQNGQIIVTKQDRDNKIVLMDLESNQTLSVVEDEEKEYQLYNQGGKGLIACQGQKIVIATIS